MASKAAIVAEHRLMSLQGWKECLVAEYGREFDIAETLPHGDIGQSHQRPLEAAAKCEHGQYSALYCRLCTDLQHDNDYKVTSETAVERKEIFCERCTDRCRCKERRRYKFIGADEWGSNWEIRPNQGTTPVPCQAYMLAPRKQGIRYYYSESDFLKAKNYRVRPPIQWLCFWIGLSKARSKCAARYCKFPLSHGHPTIRSISSGGSIGGFVSNPRIPFVRAFAITRQEMESRWCREMKQPDEWNEKVYIPYRVRVFGQWRIHWPFPRTGNHPKIGTRLPYLDEWAAEYWMRPTVTILRRPVPSRPRWSGPDGQRLETGEWVMTWRIGSRPKAGRPMNWSKRSLVKVRVRLKVKDAATLWNVSERTARRRLAEMRKAPYAAVTIS